MQVSKANSICRTDCPDTGQLFAKAESVTRAMLGFTDPDAVPKLPRSGRNEERPVEAYQCEKFILQ